MIAVSSIFTLCKTPFSRHYYDQFITKKGAWSMLTNSLYSRETEVNQLESICLESICKLTLCYLQINFNYLNMAGDIHLMLYVCSGP